MLAVRPDQVSRLGVYARAQFIELMFRTLIERFPEETATMSVETLMTSIDRGIDLASTYGIVLESDVARFLELIVGLGDDFDVKQNHHWIQEILESTILPPEVRLDLIFDSLAFQDT